MTARLPSWARHPLRSALDWVGGLVVDHIFAHEERLRRTAAHNDRQARRASRHPRPDTTRALPPHRTPGGPRT